MAGRADRRRTPWRTAERRPCEVAALARAPAAPGWLARVASALAIAVLSVGCGYHAVYAQPTGPARLHVRLARSLVADAVAADEVLAGMREELAREGLLAAGDGYPRADVEVLRADDASEGIADLAGVPLARGARVGVIARAWVVVSAGAEPSDDTGDMRGDQVLAIDTKGAVVDPRSAIVHETDALRAAARRVGRTLARKLSGEPAASDEELDPR